jgi:hypothetical protein
VPRGAGPSLFGAGPACRLAGHSSGAELAWAQVPGPRPQAPGPRPQRALLPNGPDARLDERVGLVRAETILQTLDQPRVDLADP